MKQGGSIKLRSGQSVPTPFLCGADLSFCATIYFTSIDGFELVTARQLRMADVRSAARALLGSLDGTQADSAESFESRLRTAWKNSGKGEKTAEENLERMLDKVCVPENPTWQTSPCYTPVGRGDSRGPHLVRLTLILTQSSCNAHTCDSIQSRSSGKAGDACTKHQL